MLRWFSLISVLIVSGTARAALPENITALGQGIASPSTTTLANMNRSLLGAENPAGVLYVDGFGFNMQMTKQGESTTTGYEASVSNKTLGLAIGNYRSCDTCEAQNAIILGGALKFMSLGARYETLGLTRTYGLGAIFNHTGKHRLGIHAENETSDVPDSAIMATGFGYSYVGNENVFNLEMAQAKVLTTTRTINSVGYKKKLNQLEVSLTYEMDVEASTDHFWMGAGFKGSSFTLAIYAQYNTQLLAVFSAFF